MSVSYSLSFVRAALVQESVLVAQTYRDDPSWDNVRATVRHDNLLQARTVTSGNRIFSEIHKRLSLLNAAQIELMAEANDQDVRQLIWIAICKQYAFIRDFTHEILVPAHTSSRWEVGNDEYVYFFNSKAEWHPELERISDKSRSNARQTLFLMMRQCGLLNETNQLVPQMVSSALQNCSSDSDLALIPGAIRL